MRLIRQILLAAICFGSVALAQKTTCQYDRGVDFSKFKTYKWVTIQGAAEPDAITAQNIANIVNTLLSERDLRLESAGPADLLVAFQASLHQQSQLSWFNDGGPWIGGMGQATTTLIDVGSLVIDMYDPSHRQLIWQGTATKTLDPSSNADNNYDNLQKAVSKLLKSFPPREKK